MGDPCGTEAVQDELLWQFREAADRFGAKLVFYRVRPSLLTFYLDLGLTMVKLGEEAIVDLSRFGLKGQSRASLRHAYNKMQRDAWQFSVVPKASVLGILPTLEDISLQWLEEKNTREKGISLGFLIKNIFCAVMWRLLAKMTKWSHLQIYGSRITAAKCRWI